MAKTQVLVTILRRGEKDLRPEQLQEIHAAFRDKEVVFRRTDPRDYHEHLSQCEELRPDAVILPEEKPIPSAAVERGFPHITFTPGGIMELESIDAKFKPFEPR